MGKNRVALLLLLTANAISGVAQGISMLAVPWYFAQRGWMSEFGIAYIIGAALAFFWSPYSGILIDKFDRKHILLAVDGIGAVLLGTIGGLGVYYGGLPGWAVALVFIFTFLIYNIHYPNLYAFVQEITPKRQYGKITSLIETIHQSTSVIAGAFAALLLEGTRDGGLNLFGYRIQMGWQIDPWSISEIFLLDASTYVAGLLLVSLIRYESLVKRRREVGSLVQRLRTGMTYLRENPRVFWFGMASYAVFTTVLIVNFYQGPTYVATHLGASADVFAAGKMWFALGAIGAALFIRLVFQRTSLTASVIVLSLIAFGFYVLLAFSQSVWLYYAFAITLGVCNSGTRIQRVNWLFVEVPNQVFGRAGSILFIVNTAIRIGFVGLFALPFFQQPKFIPLTFGILGLYVLAAAGIMTLWYRWLETRPDKGRLPAAEKTKELSARSR